MPGSSTANSSPPYLAEQAAVAEHVGPLGDRLAKQQVAGLVAVLVVVALEAVEVDERDGQRRPVVLRGPAGGAQLVVPGTPVGCAGQRVAAGKAASCTD